MGGPGWASLCGRQAKSGPPWPLSPSPSPSSSGGKFVLDVKRQTIRRRCEAINLIVLLPAGWPVQRYSTVRLAGAFLRARASQRQVARWLAAAFQPPLSRLRRPFGCGPLKVKSSWFAANERAGGSRSARPPARSLVRPSVGRAQPLPMSAGEASNAAASNLK